MISPKQKKILAFPYSEYDAIICDGAVRSGKTSIMTVAFIDWAMCEFNGQWFGICGKTVDSATKNIIIPYISMAYAKQKYTLRWRRTDKLLEVCRGAVTNWFEVFGGKDESSFMLIQGRTLAGILLDEVALMPESFVNQALARCSVDGARLWFSCNPENPNHWFYTNWIQRHNERNALYLRFAMTDNPSLSEKTLARYQAMYSGVFYQRYIQGLWVSAEGKIYMSFSKANIIPKTEWNATDEHGRPIYPLRNRICVVTMGVDFGGNKSSHAFVLTGFTRGYREMITLKELRIREEIDPAELENRFVRFVQDCKKEYPMLSAVYCDSAEQVLIRGFRNAARANHLSVYIRNAAKGEIIDRIRFYCAMQAQGRHMILSDCTETIQAFDDALWDPDKEDVRLDDGSTNIDNLDAQEYSSEPYMKIMLDMTGHGESYG